MGAGGMSPALRGQVDQMLKSAGVCSPCAADVGLALLRLGTDEARRAAEDVLGLTITKCPAALPPPLPKPARREAQGPGVKVLLDNPASPKTDAYRRFALVRDGMSREKLLAKGVTVRDLRVWENRRWITWTT